jgi:hypothetical protein
VKKIGEKFLNILKIIGLLLLATALASENLYAADPAQIATDFSARRNAVIDVILNSNINTTDSYGRKNLKAAAILAYAEETGDTGQIDLANNLIMSSLAELNPAVKEYHDIRWMLGYHIELIRIYLVYKNREDLLRPSTKAAMIDKSNPGSLWTLAKRYSYLKAASIGMYTWTFPFEGQTLWTENHRLFVAVQGMGLSMVFEGHTYDAKDGLVNFKDASKNMDLFRYYKNYYYRWLTAHRGNEDHTKEGVGEKDTTSYSGTYSGAFLFARDLLYYEDPIASKMSEVIYDLHTIDIISEQTAGGINTGAKGRGTDPHTNLRQKARGMNLLGYLVSDNQRLTIGQLFNSTQRQMGCLLGAHILAINDLYTPAHPDFPHVIIDIGANRPAAGYMQYESGRPGLGRAEINWIKPDYALGFQIRWESRHVGGLYVDDGSSATTSGLWVIPYVGANVDFDTKASAINAKPEGFVAPDTAIFKLTSGNERLKIAIRDGFDSVDYSDPRWIFLKELNSVSGKTTYAAIGAVEGTHSPKGTAGKPGYTGKVREFSNAKTFTIWEVSDSDRHVSFSAFKTDVKNNTLTFLKGVVTYVNSAGVEVKYSDFDQSRGFVNGTAVVFADTLDVVFSNPWGQWKMGSRQASFSKNGNTVDYNFDPNNDNNFVDIQKIVDNAGGMDSIPPSVPPTPSPTDPQINITNPGFEYGRVGWSLLSGNSGNAYTLTSPVYEGANAFRLGKGRQYNQDIAVNGGETYAVSAWVESSNVSKNSVAQLTVMYLDGVTTLSSFTTSPVSGLSWTQLTAGPLIAPSGTTTLRIVLETTAGGGYAVWDAVSVVEGTTSTETNQAPTAVDDNATTEQDVVATIDVLENDNDQNSSDKLTVSAVTQGADGTVTNNGTDVTYTPNIGFSGSDNFTYTISDGNGFDTAMVNVTVTSRPTSNKPDNEGGNEEDETNEKEEIGGGSFDLYALLMLLLGGMLRRVVQWRAQRISCLIPLVFSSTQITIPNKIKHAYKD